MRLRLIPIALGLLLLGACQYGKDNFPSPEEGSVILTDQLSNQRVNCFAEDRHGHLWMGTLRGLNKFDGQLFQQYFCTGDTLGLPDNQINALRRAQDGQLWIATVGGVATFTDQGNFRRVPVLDANQNFSQILETRGGKLLFFSSSSLMTYDPEQGAIRPVLRDLGAFGAPAVALDGEDRLWVISGGGWQLSCYSTKDFALLSTTQVPFQAYHLCDALDGTLWLSGMGRLGILEASTLQWQPLPASIQARRGLMQGDVDILYAIDNQTMLLNVIGQGFYCYQRNLDTVLFEDEASFPVDIPDTEIRSIYRDARGNLWLGTTDHGYSVSYHEKGQFNGNKSLVQAFKGKSVTALCPDRSGNLWINTLRDGLWCYQLASQKLQRVDIEQLIPDTSVGYIRTSSVYCDSEGELWLLFTDKMRVLRCRWDGKKLHQTDAFFFYNPMCVEEDDQGHIWVGGFSPALLCYDKSTRKSSYVSVVNEGEWTYVPDLLLKEAGRLEAARFSMPPVVINTYTQEWQPVTILPEDKAATIRRSTLIPTCLFQDSGGDVWVGTITNGLLLSSRQTGRPVAVEGLPCQDVCAIEEDRQGIIWVSTMHGLAKYDRTVDRFVYYFEPDGTGGDQYSERASCVLPDGTLVFGGTHGLTWFNPLDAPAKRTVPLVFENLTIHNQLVSPSPEGPIQKELSERPLVTIRHNQNAFNISFAALDYSEFEQIRYAYKLEGFDKDWVRINTRHDAYFANLPAGKYQLRVKIANGSHSITETEESLQVRVLPPWYASWWAILLWVLLGGVMIGALYTFYRHVRRVRKEAARHIREVRREREKAEEAEKAEKELNKIQMNYFSNVAHEFRTPLTMIAGPAQQLSESEGVQGQDKKLVDIIRRNTTWMLSLVNQLLDFNRIGNSKLQMKVAKMDIVEPLRDIANLFRFNAHSKGIELTTYGLEDPFTMWVDADKVQKVVMNLLSNALKFTPSGGKVSLSFDVISREEAARRFPLTDTDRDGQWALFSVSDSGPGIPEDQMEKIFERFYQSEAGKKVTGSGIGLFYARALSTLHHGYIKAWNREEGGAVFGMVLPVSAQSYSEDERQVETPQLPTHALAESITADLPDDESAKRHIVVVDDDIDIANYLKVLLKPKYKVSLYFDAASALKGMEEDVPDLVISDVVMPGMSGYQLCEQIKGDLQLSHIPVVLVTAKVAVESQVQGLDKGADAYVTKPFQPAYLMALVKSILENREKLHRQLGSVTTTDEIEPEALSPRDAAFMKELYELMEKELANTDLDITRMTEMMKISRTKFYYKVKGLTGENPSVFFKRYKLNRAADLLKEGKFNMSEIAYMTGFNTLSHFSTSFKKQFGVPPSEYGG